MPSMLRLGKPMGFKRRNPHLEEQHEVVEDVPRVFVQVERQLDEDAELRLKHAFLAYLSDVRYRTLQRKRIKPGDPNANQYTC